MKTSKSSRGFWLTPYPELIISFFNRIFRKRANRNNKKLDNHRAFLVSLILIFFMIIGYIIVSLIIGQSIDIVSDIISEFISVPQDSLSSFYDIIGNRLSHSLGPGNNTQRVIGNMTTYYYIISAMVVAFPVFLESKFIFNSENQKFFSLLWIVKMILALFTKRFFDSVVILIFLKIAKYYYVIENFLEDTFPLMIFLLFIYHFCSYFIVKSLVSDLIIVYIAPFIADFICCFNIYLPKLFLLFSILIILKLIMELLDKFKVTEFIKDKFVYFAYTPKGILQTTFCFLLIVYLIFRKSKDKDD